MQFLLPTSTITSLPPVEILASKTLIAQSVSSTLTPTPISLTALPPAPSCTPAQNGSASFWQGILAGLTGASLAAAYNLLRKNWRPSFAALLPPIKIRVPKFIEYYTTVSEWIGEKVKYMAKVVRWVWETIKTLVRNFITQVRKIVDWIKHSKWVTTTRRVLKTFWESVKKRVPLLGWLGRIIGWFWKTVIEPVRRWVRETVRKLRTWAEKVVRYVRERVQDGWKTITSRIRKQVTDWVERTKWVRKLVHRRIKIRKQDGWEYKTYFGGGGGKMASLMPPKKVLQQMLVAGLLTGVMVSLNGCICNMKEIIPFVPTCTPEVAGCSPEELTATTVSGSSTAAVATEGYALTQAWESANAKLTQTAMAVTTTPMPTATPTPLTLPAMTYEVKKNDNCQGIAASKGISLTQLYNANPTIKTNDPTKCNIHIGDKLTIPEQVIRTPAENIALYNCAGTPPKNAGDVCLSPTDSVDTMLTHVLFGEGGSTIGASASANEMYVLITRANQILREHGIEPTDRDAITDEQYKQFLVQVASQTYYDGAGNAYPAFNAFDAAVAHPKEGEYGYDNWNSAAAIVNSAVASRGQTWVVDSRNDNDSLNDAIGKSVIAYCAPAPGSPDPNSLNPPVYFEARDYTNASGNQQYQFYFDYNQFYNGGKAYCEQYANYK